MAATAAIKLNAFGEVRVVSQTANSGRPERPRRNFNKRLKLQETDVDSFRLGNAAGIVDRFGEVRLVRQERTPPRFTRRGAETLKEFGAVSDKRFGCNQVFLTWTIPGSSSKIYSIVAEESAYITGRVMQWLRDHVVSPWVGWVFEFQKRGALHQHLLVGSEDTNGLHTVMCFWADFIGDLFEQLSVRTGVDLFRNAETGKDNRASAGTGQDAEFVRASAARYLAKYLSKNVRCTAKNAYAAPVRWWRVNNAALREIKTRRSSFSVRHTSASVLADHIGVIRQQLELRSAKVWEYANAQFSWMRNVVAWHCSFESGEASYYQLLSELQASGTEVGCEPRPRLEKARAAEAVLAAVAPSEALPWVAQLFRGRLVSPSRPDTG